MKFCGRDFSSIEITKILKMIEKEPTWSRARLSREICIELGWRKIDGSLKDMSCRVAMLKMQADGILRLPAPKNGNGNGKAYNCRSIIEPDSNLICQIEQLSSLKCTLVNSTKESYLWNDFVDTYHYLGHKTLPGAQLRYFISLNDRILALLGFGASAWKIYERDRFIGWSPLERKRNLHLIVNNARLLTLPWIKCPNLISWSLSRVLKRLPIDWEKRYKYRPVLVETFVQDDKFQGTCYKASNWKYIGKTKGRGKLDRFNLSSIPVKSIWIYPLIADFKKYLLNRKT